MAVKLSISVPDDLWDQAVAKSFGAPPSRLVQDALRDWVKAETMVSQPYVVDVPDAIGARFASVRERFVAEAQKEFERGYESAIETAGELEWSDIEWLSSMGFSVLKWAKAYGEWALNKELGQWLPEGVEGPPRQVVDALAKGLGAYVDHPAFAERGHPGAVFIEGYTKAFRDLWTSVTTPTAILQGATEVAEAEG